MRPDFFHGQDPADAQRTTWCWRRPPTSGGGAALRPARRRHMPTVIAPDLSNLPPGWDGDRSGDRRGVQQGLTAWRVHRRHEMLSTRSGDAQNRIFLHMAIAEPPAQVTTDKGLQAGALGLVGNVVIGLSAVAPAYSLAATLGYVVLAVGDKAPSMFLLAFIPMLLVAFAYKELSQDTPDCGTTFTWGTKAFGPWIGWIGGWGLAVSAIIVLANVAEVAAIYLFKFLGQDELAENLWAKVALGSFFIVADDARQRARHRGVRTDPERPDRHPVRRVDRRQHHRADPGVRRHRRRAGRSARHWPGCGRAAWTATRSPRRSSCASSSTGAGTPAWPSARRPRTPARPRASRPSSPR